MKAAPVYTPFLVSYSKQQSTSPRDGPKYELVKLPWRPAWQERDTNHAGSCSRFARCDLSDTGWIAGASERFKAAMLPAMQQFYQHVSADTDPVVKPDSTERETKWQTACDRTCLHKSGKRGWCLSQIVYPLLFERSCHMSDDQYHALRTVLYSHNAHEIRAEHLKADLSRISLVAKIVITKGVSASFQVLAIENKCVSRIQ